MTDATYHPKYGAATYVREDLNARSVVVDSHQSNSYVTAIEGSGITVVNIYKPPGVEWPTPALSILPHPTVYAGDSNSHSTEWGYRVSYKAGDQLSQWENDNNFHLLYDPKQNGSFHSARWKKDYSPDLCFVIPPSHRRRGATTVLVRHKPQWHSHDRRGSTVVPSLIVVVPRTIVKTADLRGSTAATFNMFRCASAVLVPSHRRRGATAVLVRHDRRGSAVVPSLIAVAPRKTVKTADLRGGTAETLNMFKTSAVPRGLGQSAVGSPRHRHDRRGTAMTAVAPYKNHSSTPITAVPPQYNRRAIAKK